MNKARWNKGKDKVFQGVGIFSTLIGIAALFIFIGNILGDGLSRLDWDFLTHFPSRHPEESGIFTAWHGTLWVLVITTLFAFPIGVGAGIYLEEYTKKNWLSRFLDINITNLAGVPSIIYGLLGLEIFVRIMNFGPSILAGSLTLALLILPIIIVATREALRAVPSSIRDGARAMGASKWQMIRTQILPASIGGIMTGVILAISRAGLCPLHSQVPHG